MFVTVSCCNKHHPQIRYILATGSAEEAEILSFPSFPLGAAAAGTGAAAGAPAAAAAAVASTGDDGAAAAAAAVASDTAVVSGGEGDGAADPERERDARELGRLLDVARALAKRGLLISVSCVAFRCVSCGPAYFVVCAA